MRTVSGRQETPEHSKGADRATLLLLGWRKAALHDDTPRSEGNIAGAGEDGIRKREKPTPHGFCSQPHTGPLAFLSFLPWPFILISSHVLLSLLHRNSTAWNIPPFLYQPSHQQKDSQTKRIVHLFSLTPENYLCISNKDLKN